MVVWSSSFQKLEASTGNIPKLLCVASTGTRDGDNRGAWGIFGLLFRAAAEDFGSEVLEDSDEVDEGADVLGVEESTPGDKEEEEGANVSSPGDEEGPALTERDGEVADEEELEAAAE